jgi:IclR family mhp operon transcriptional activator
MRGTVKMGEGSIRSLTRALHILDTLGELGWSRPAEIARHAGLDRVTVYRILQTLVASSYVMRREQDGRYFLSPRLKHLAAAIRGEDILTTMTRPALSRLVLKIHWPSDFATISAGRLTIIDSNYSLTTLTLFRTVVGQTLPIMRSSLGRAALAWMKTDQLEETIASIASVGGSNAADLSDRVRVGEILEVTRQLGFAAVAGDAVSGIAAIARPVFHENRVVGAVNVQMFISAYDRDNAIAAYGPALLECVAEIEKTFADVDHSKSSKVAA